MINLVIEHTNTAGQTSTTHISLTWGQLFHQVTSVVKQAVASSTPETPSPVVAVESSEFTVSSRKPTKKATPPKTEAPKTEAPKTEAPKTEAPKTETPDPLDDLVNDSGLSAEEMRGQVLHAAGKIGARVVADLLKETGGSERITQISPTKYLAVKTALDKALAEAGKPTSDEEDLLS